VAAARTQRRRWRRAEQARARAARPAQAREVWEWARRLVARVPSELAAWRKTGGSVRAQAEASDGGVAAHGQHKSRSGAQGQAALEWVAQARWWRGRRGAKAHAARACAGVAQQGWSKRGSGSRKRRSSRVNVQNDGVQRMAVSPLSELRPRPVGVQEGRARCGRSCSVAATGESAREQ
jgi:hypothetical protein